MKINIVFLKSEKDFTKKQKQKIRDIVRGGCKDTAKLLGIKEPVINFTIYPFNKNYVGGFAQAKDFINISIPRKGFSEDYLRSTVYHEMHHVKRGYVGYAEKISLLESLFVEGSATVFALEQVPEYVPKWSKYSKKMLDKWLPDVEKEKHKTGYSHDEWFFGAKGKPFQLGYKLGVYFVRRIQKNYPDIKQEALVNKSAKDLLKMADL